MVKMIKTWSDPALEEWIGKQAKNLNLRKMDIKRILGKKLTSQDVKLEINNILRPRR